MARPIYRLRGKIDEKDILIDLPAGELEVGSSRSTDIPLPAIGISRRHALLTVSPSALVVEDLASTNGTAINGVKVLRSGVPVGAELRFGPVRLQVEAVEPDDGELAIVLEPAATGFAADEQPSGLERDEKTVIVEDDAQAQGGAWLTWIADFAERLQADPGGGLTAALAFLGEQLGAEGCCAVQWPATGDPVALAAWSSVHEIPALADLRRLAPGEGEKTAGTGVVAFLETAPLLSVAVGHLHAAEPIGLLIWGPFASRAVSSPLLRTLVLLIETFARPTGAHSENRAKPIPHGESELIFPPRYRPGISPPMIKLYARMRPLLKGKLPVLISGETGVGKELVAHILHRSSDRRSGPFVAVNCAAIPNDLLEAEMFGISKGVATGVEARRGKFQLAEGGTLFLDEIGDMAPALQAKLLRALQEQEIHPLGGTTQPIDVRVISATNVDLTEHLDRGALRGDLFYRLAGFVLEVPPLRRCPEDIPGLVEHFLRLFTQETGARLRGLTVAALRQLTSYSWPGNIRELEHEIRHLVYTSTHDQVIGAEQISKRLRRPAQASPVEGLIREAESLHMAPLVHALEERLIREALRRADGKKIRACRLLGLSRNGLDKKMKRLGIEIEVD